MRLTVSDDKAHADELVADEGTLLARLVETLLDGRNKLGRNVCTDGVVDKLIAIGILRVVQRLDATTIV